MRFKIGRYLDHAPDIALNRLMETRLVPFTQHTDQPNEGCLLGAISGTAVDWGIHSYPGLTDFDYDEIHMPETGQAARQFNRLCQRLGGVPHSKRTDFGCFAADRSHREWGAKAAVLMRNRILRVRACRALQGVRESVTV